MSFKDEYKLDELRGLTFFGRYAEKKFAAAEEAWRSALMLNQVR